MARAVDAGDGLGEEAGSHAHLGRDLTADQLVELNLVSGSDDIAVGVINLELRRSDFRVVLLVLETHRALHFRGGVDELAERVTGERVVVTALVDVLEGASLVVVTLGVDAIEEEALNLIGGVERVSVLLKLLLGEVLEDATKIAGVVPTVLVDHLAEDEDLAGAEDVGGSPVEGAPIEGEAEITLALGRKAADRRAIEGEIIVALDEEFLVVVEHVEPAFEVRKEHGHGLDAGRVGEVLQTLFL